MFAVVKRDCKYYAREFGSVNEDMAYYIEENMISEPVIVCDSLSEVTMYGIDLNEIEVE